MPLTFNVSGRLTRSDGTAVSNAIVKVFEKKLRSEVLISDTNTDLRGSYQITFDADSKPDIMIRAYESKKESACSGPHHKIARKKKINLVSGNKTYKSQYAKSRYLKKVSEKLEGLKLSELGSDEIKILCGKTGISVKKLKQLADAESLAFCSNISEDFLFGIISSGIDSDLYNLAIQSDTILSNAIKKAVKINEIPESESEEAAITSNITRLRTAAARKALSDTSVRTNMYWMLKTTPLGEKAKVTFLTTLYANSNNFTKTFKQLEKNKIFNKSNVVEKIKKVFEIGSLTANCSTLVNVINKKITKTNPLSSFSFYTKDDWEGLIKNNRICVPQAIEGKTMNEKIRYFSEMLTRNFAKAFPSKK